MHCSSSVTIIGIFHFLFTFHVAAVPFSSSAFLEFTKINTSSIGEQNHALNEQALTSSVSANATLQSTHQPWPPAPFNFRSEKSPEWVLNIHSYASAELIYRQKWALLAICTEYIKWLSRVRDLAKMPARTVVMVTDQTSPTDLSREDVEIAFFNSAHEPGAEFRVGDAIEILNMISRTVITGDMRDLVRTVAHYAEARPIRNVRVFKRIAIRPKTKLLSTAVA
ncbi:hypothetical protein G7Y79_00014g036330 [Physcia stellaris]|nr:hypothetical protein G7Y79_00014g036330 [Physcia stellaris]